MKIPADWRLDWPDHRHFCGSGLSGRSTTKAFVLSCDNSPAQRSKFNAHRGLPRFNAVLAARGQIRFPRRREPTVAAVMWRGTEHVQEAEQAKRFGERV